MSYPFRDKFLPWPRTPLFTLAKPDGDMKPFWEAHARDFAYVQPNTNFAESASGDLPIPSTLVNPDTGVRITTPEEWPALRKLHLRNITRIFYGELPPKPQSREVELLKEKEVFDGTALQRILKLTLCNDGKRHEVTVLCYIPKAAQPVPAIVAMNFPGNHGCTDDPDVPLSPWRDQQKPRGEGKNRWNFRLLTDAGFAVITCARYDFYPDDVFGRKESVFRLFHDESELTPRDRQYTSISAWAYGYSILRELAASFPEINAKDIWAHGHSRLGKTALWTIANDPEWAGAISNCSGCAGAKISRRNYGETLEVIDHFFPWWVTHEALPYAQNPAILPFDQHTLIALAAPRPVLVTSAHEDQWADPMGQFLAVKGAQETYELLGGKPLPSQEYPALEEVLMSPSLGYYERHGIHDVTDQDWTNVINFIRQTR